MSETRSPDAGDFGDLRAAITGAIAESRNNSSAPPPPAPESEAAPPREEEGAPRATPGRDPETGQFLAPAEDGEPPQEETGAEDGGEEPREPREPRAPAVVEAPEHWSADDKAQFQALPAAARGPFLQLYKRMEAGLTPRLQRGAHLEREYGALEQNVFTPRVRGLMAEANIPSAQELIRRWSVTEDAIHNPQTRNLAFAHLINNYQADAGQIVQILNGIRGFPQVVSRDDGRPVGTNGAAPPAPAPATNGAAPIHPMLQHQIDTLMQERDQRALERLRQVDTAIMGFANETDAQGNLTHPYLAQVQETMATLYSTERALGREPSLQYLYDVATGADPAIQQRIQASQRQAEAKRRQDEQKARSERAQRAASSVSGHPGPGQTSEQPTDMSLRDTIRGAMRGPQTSGGPGRI